MIRVPMRLTVELSTEDDGHSTCLIEVGADVPEDPTLRCAAMSVAGFLLLRQAAALSSLGVEGYVDQLKLKIDKLISGTRKMKLGDKE